MEEIGKLIKRLRGERGLTQGQLATYAKVPRSWLSVLELGRIQQPDVDRLKRIASILEVDPNILLAAGGYEVGPALPRPRRTPQELLRELEATTPILVYETEQPASAGPGIIAEPGAEYWPFLPEPGERNHRFVAVPVRGDCMEPRLRDGERVIIDKDASPHPGDIVVAIHDDEILIKELQRRNGELVLIALRKRPVVKVGDRTQIIGVVRMVMHKP